MKVKVLCCEEPAERGTCKGFYVDIPVSDQADIHLLCSAGEPSSTLIYSSASTHFLLSLLRFPFFPPNATQAQQQRIRGDDTTWHEAAVAPAPSSSSSSASPSSSSSLSSRPAAATTSSVAATQPAAVSTGLTASQEPTPTALHRAPPRRRRRQQLQGVRWANFTGATAGARRWRRADHQRD